MAVTNTGVVLRTITGVNESDLFLDSEATSTATNTGIVERSILGVHDANFVHPLGDEELNTGTITNAGGGSFTLTDSGLKAVSDGTSVSTIRPRILWNTLTIGRQYRIVGTPTVNSGNTTYSIYDGAAYVQQSLAVESFDITFTCDGESVFFVNDGTQTFDIDWELSIKEVLVNRESTTTNTGIVERPITGVNESDPMFPDNTISNIVNISGLISSLIADLKARATTFENEEATQEILINLQKC